MAAYAALVSLMNTIDHIQIHPLLCNSIDKKHMESLSVHLSFLLDFVESNHSHGAYNNEAELLESQIARAAHAAEDAIESHVVDQIHSGSISLLDLQTTMHDMDYVKDKVLIVKEWIFKDDVPEGPTYSLPNPSTSSSNGKSKMVRFDEELVQLSEALTEQQSSLQIIPIVGMGGIGKTTLASYFYDSSLILDTLIFVLGLQYLKAQQLYQSLIGRKYLIILDDIWSIEVWEKIKSYFPDNNNGSRIIVTTRLSNVASHFVSSYFSKKLLDEDESWKLFRETAFPQEACCPSELEEIGKNIAKKCKGLPLLILVIGGLLRKSSRSQELWEIISKDINSIPSLIEEEQNLDILSLSYKHVNCDPLLRNVQTLKIGGTQRFVAPSVIWSMPQLRHVEFSAGINLPEPLLRSQENDEFIVLKNLQTIKKVVNLNLSEEVCKRIPNVKKLNIVYEGFSKSSCYNNLYNTSMLHKLELLCIDFGDLSVLENTENSNLLRNNAESVHFPVLENLVLNGIFQLDEIPSGIGEIPTLDIIQMFNCSESAAVSAAKILEEQESLGNSYIQKLLCQNS
ncbi:hypothetical protein MIMGU_mgv1a025857mg [Erythranthe guttata]|uniref:NB-ARC domain-containing protein n=1 Tax=Erythranthe guttata TaxID=4155 RepID=A0A022QNK9_ERYGU|nr:hypothetical protein MIMGU_mgv1a025857mg [Erythranthe guttata]